MWPLRVERWASWSSTLESRDASCRTVYEVTQEWMKLHWLLPVAFLNNRFHLFPTTESNDWALYPPLMRWIT